MKQVLIFIVAIIATFNVNNVEGLKLTMLPALRGVQRASMGGPKIQFAPIDTKDTFAGSVLFNNGNRHPNGKYEERVVVQRKSETEKQDEQEKKHMITEIKEGLKGKSKKEAAALGYESAQCAGLGEQQSRLAGHLMGGIASQTVDEFVGKADPTSMGVLSKILYGHAVIFRAGAIALPPVCPQAVAAKTFLAGASWAAAGAAKGVKKIDDWKTNTERVLAAGEGLTKKA